MRRSSRGYSLIELVIVLAILGILTSLAVPLAEVTVQRGKERELKRALWEIRDAIDGYRRVREGVAFNGGSLSPYPADLLALTQLVADARASHRGEFHRFLRKVPRDPFADPALPAEKTWGVRSYLSEADQPKSGKDVFDVFSMAPGLALNGVPLRQW